MAKRSLGRLQLAEPYVCTPCLLKQSLRVHPINYTRKTQISRATFLVVPAHSKRRHQVRYPTVSRNASTTSLASSTAINAPSTVPHAYRELHQELQRLLDVAREHVDVAQIQLALRSLESEDPVTRVALLGLGPDGALTARKVALALLSDALGEEQAWEKELLDTARDGRSLLLRFGDEEDLAQSTPVLRSINVPAPFLGRNRIELLIETLNVDSETTRQMDRAQTEKAVLVPALPTPTSADGRVVFIRYPVHKAMIVADGVQGAVQYGRLPTELADGELINAALDIPLRSASSITGAEVGSSINVIDVDLALNAIGLFRTSNEHGAQYGRDWQASQLGHVSDWIIDKKADMLTVLPSSVLRFLQFAMKTASDSVQHGEAETHHTQAITTVPQEKRLDIEAAIDDWSAGAHKDLQFNLHRALDSKPWKRTAWFRLLWRVDDVSASTADILRRQWLTEAEQTLAYLSGRLVEAGLATPADLKESAATPAAVDEEVQLAQAVQDAQDERIEAATELLQMPTMLSRLQHQSEGHVLLDPPWPHTISLNRTLMLDTLVPNMHRKAQTLLLSTLSTVAGTGALAGWLWVASAGSMLYEAGAVAALGSVWALRRLQRLWGREREQFSTTLQEDGRRVLAEVESGLKTCTRGNRRSFSDMAHEADTREARLAIERCQDALARVIAR